MKHYALAVQYDGTLFSGFQRQTGVPTIQAELEAALSSIADEPITITAAGRTDRGVHATQQVVSFSTSVARQGKAWRLGSNSLLPNTIAVEWVCEVPASFSARFAALWRRYFYVYGQRSLQQVFDRNYASWIEESLDVERMNQAAQLFLGEQDFSSIRAAKCTSTTPSRYVYHILVERAGQFVVIDVAANAFLLHMVRNLSAVLRYVGSGKFSIDDVRALLAATNRDTAPPTAAAQGLYLTAVGYENALNLNATALIPSFLGDVQARFPDVTLPCDHYRRQPLP